VKTILLLLTVLSVGCANYVSPEHGEVAVMVKKPWIFGSGGVDPEIYTTGLHWKFWSTEGYRVSITPWQVTEKFDNLITSDNVPVDFNGYLKGQVISGKTPLLYSKFGGKGWYNRNIMEKFRTYIRSYAKTQPLFKLTTDDKVIDRMQIKVKEQITAYVEEIGLPIIVLDVIIGKVSPPDAVIKQTEETAAQKQRDKTEAQRALTEITRKTAEENKALADKAYRIKFGMSVAEYLQLRALEIEQERIKMAREKENVTIVMGPATPMFSIKR